MRLLFRRVIIPCAWFLLSIVSLACTRATVPTEPRQTRAEGFVYVQDDHFAIDGEDWFPLMLNYRIEWKMLRAEATLIPATYYYPASLSRHFDTVKSLGFNAVRICMDVESSDAKGPYFATGGEPLYLERDSAVIFRIIERELVEPAEQRGLRLMLLLKPPFDESHATFVKAILSHFSHCPTIFAYDFFNEPLYFDPQTDRPKQEAPFLVAQWREWMCRYAPHQLFTIGMGEPIEVFEWDPSLLPVDFVEMHTYHPLRVASEMYWYGHYQHKPWIVGETSLPADGDSVEYHWQSLFLRESFSVARQYGACGYGWWEFQDCPWGVNYEAQYAGIFDAQGVAKPVAFGFASLAQMDEKSNTEPPVNYYNMLGYHNYCLNTVVIDAQTRQPIEGAVLRGWNESWNVGMNTFSNPQGVCTLYSNDRCTHFQLSAPGYKMVRRDTQDINYSPDTSVVKPTEDFPDRLLEYQQLSWRPFVHSQDAILRFDSAQFSSSVWHGALDTFWLEKITLQK